MDFIIDTHVLIWYLDGDETLPEHIYQQINDPKNTVYVCIASLWELAIKFASGKIQSNNYTFREIEQHILLRKFRILGINFSHLATLIELPKSHGDPFDRLIIAQAIKEKLPIYSKDRHFQAYPVDVIW